MNNADIFQDLFEPQDQQGQLLGVTIGVVTNNQDPDNLHRVKVRYPWLTDEDESNWARVVTPMAGGGRGLYFLPEVDDEVLVTFEHGDLRFPYVIGALWNGKDKPPATNEDGKNDQRVIKSRSGHVIRLDDTDGDEKIEITDSSQKNSIVINTKDNSISISANADITIESSSGKLKLSGSGVEINSTGEVKIEATGNMGLKGMAVKAEATGNMDLNANGMLNVKGSMVKIN